MNDRDITDHPDLQAIDMAEAGVGLRRVHDGLVAGGFAPHEARDIVARTIVLSHQTNEGPPDA